MDMREVSLKTLLVEDNPGDARLLREHLHDARADGIDLVHVSGLEAALDMVAEGGIDLVLLDLGLPEMRGYDTFDAFFKRAPDIPIVVLTGIDDTELALRAVQGGAQDYLVKGQVDGAALLRSISYAVERHRLLRKIEEQARELERDRIRSRFVEIIAHELRNPMSSAKAILALLRLRSRRNDIPADLCDRLETAEREIDRVSKMLNDVLDAFQADRRQISLARLDTNLLDIVAAALKPYQLSAPRHRFALRVDGERDAFWTLGDPCRLEQVVRILLDNAVQYSPDGGLVEFRLFREGEAIAVHARDEGLGIPDSQLESVFEGFYRTTVAAGLDLHGLGLGLFIARTIVEEHGGRIWAMNNGSGGSTFCLRLPACRSSS